jgi:hypothetical protein
MWERHNLGDSFNGRRKDEGKAMILSQAASMGVAVFLYGFGLILLKEDCHNYALVSFLVSGICVFFALCEVCGKIMP